MVARMPGELETLLRQWREGDDSAREQVVGMVYRDLRRLAAWYLRQERPGHTLQPTALVNEAFVRLSNGEQIQWRDRSHFFAVAARQMRRVLIDHARRRKAAKRGDEKIPVTDAAGHAGPSPRIEDVLAVNQVLEDLESLDPRAAQVVELRVFGGLSEAEIADVVGTSVATVKRDWTFARAWLIARLPL